MEEMINKFHQIYEKMASSHDVEDMRIFGESAAKMYEKIATMSPNTAREWLEHLEPIMWCNYLSLEKAKTIAAALVNQDGAKGPHWPMEVFFNAVEKLGGTIEDEPAYNRYALWLVANAHYSDFAVSTAMDMGYKSVAEAPDEKMALSMYRKAIESLKDVDRKHYIRDYYHL